MKTKMPYDEAIQIAERYRDALAFDCINCEIAGSLRRKKPEVGDIEICIQPLGIPQIDLFGEVVGVNCPVYRIIDHVFDGIERIKDGERYKQFALPEGVALDLFIIKPPAQWGYQFAIRTGPAEFNKWLVTTRQKGGVLPSNCKSIGGAIYCAGEMIEMPTEQSYFEFLGLDWIAPEDRTPPERWIPF